MSEQDNLMDGMDHYQDELKGQGDSESSLNDLLSSPPVTSDKWHWMMDYCKRKGIPPAQYWAWNLAKKAYDSRGMS